MGADVFEVLEAEWKKVLDNRVVIDPLSQKSKWYCSRLVVNLNGTTESLLELKAKVLFVQILPGQRAYWKDQNWHNESWENIGLGTLWSSNPKPRGRPGTLGIKAPSMSKEYRREYHQKNPEKMKLYAHRAYVKRKEELDHLRKLAAKKQGEEVIKITPQDAEMGKRLSGILGLPEEETK